MIPYKKSAYDLLHKGTLALSIVEENGLRIDEEYLNNAIKKTEREIKSLQEKQKESKVYKIWRQTFGRKMNLESNDQLGAILFDKMGYEASSLTPTGKPKTNEEALGFVDDPFVEKYLEIKKLQKALSTYLRGIQREIVDGFIHPFFSLGTTTTYRSSSQSPNFQNIPIRNPVIGKLVRSAFVARPGRRIVEIDYSGMEVGAAACYHKDPNMMNYINDKSKDMHRDMAAKCYKLEQKEITKDTRFCGKSGFVFPQFYGDWYIDCARNLWEYIDTLDLKTVSGIPLKEHLKSQGIQRLGDLNPKEKPNSGTFEKHIQEVEQDFWNMRFPVYSKWKKQWVKKYQQKGFMKTKTGFICQGFMKTNEIINYPVQGSAFHCLLWALIRLVLLELPKRKMKTLIVGQIHDSIVADVPDNEIQEFLSLANYVMTKMIRKAFKWLIVPLEIEAEVSPIDGSWAEKKEWIYKNGLWQENKKE